MWIRFFLYMVTVGFIVNFVYIGSSIADNGTVPNLLGILFALVAMFGAAFVFSRLIAASFIKDISEIIEYIHKVEFGENLGPINVTRKDELGTLQKVIGKLANKDKAVQEANEDPLTGLANRRFLMQRMEGLTKSEAKYVAFFIDLDGFKPINDKFGHDVGDEALQVVSDRLSACVREEDVLCRLGGDEFVIVLVNLDNRQVAEQRANKILELVGQPIWISGNRVRLGASIGIAFAPEDGDDAEAVLNAADESMYAAKQGGKNQFRFYS